MIMLLPDILAIIVGIVGAMMIVGGGIGITYYGIGYFRLAREYRRLGKRPHRDAHPTPPKHA
jgi:hypothetical protein